MSKVMKIILAALLLVSCGGAQASFTLTIATACPYGSSYADGCPAADAGTSAQYPSLLTGYATRPPWNVAGVDYGVGVPTGTSLQDPTTASLPSGCSFGGSTVSCSGNNITVQGYDFSLHSTKLSFASGSTNIVITQNKFGGTSCTDPTLYMTGVGNTTITYNTIDGGGAICGTPAFGSTVTISSLNGTTATLEYNWIKNAPEDMVRFSGPASGSATIIEKYNLLDTQGWSGHPDGIQLGGGNFSSSFYSFNTYRNLDIGQGVNLPGTQPVHIEAQLTAAITNYTVNNNAVITPGTGWQTANYDIACKQDAGSNTNTGFAAYGNYIDWSGALGPTTNGYGCTSTTWGSPTPNYDLTTGSVIP